MLIRRVRTLLTLQMTRTYGNAGDEGLFAFEGAANGNGPWEWIDTAAVKAEAVAWGQDG